MEYFDAGYHVKLMHWLLGYNVLYFLCFSINMQEENSRDHELFKGLRIIELQELLATFPYAPLDLLWGFAAAQVLQLFRVYSRYNMCTA